jgi:hypothetical protein
MANETSPKRCSSTILEKRKRSLAHSSDDEVGLQTTIVFKVWAYLNFFHS